MRTELQYFAHDSSVIDEGAHIGERTKIWHFCHIMKDAVIGEDCNIGQNVFVAGGVVIGNNVKIQNNVSIYSGVSCEDNVFIGPSVVFTNIPNPRSHIPQKDKYVPTKVKKGATIGANATIVCGNTIGEYAFIGAGSVITRDIPDFALFVGNPGNQMGWMSKHGHKLQFDKDGFAICDMSKERYRLIGNVVKLI